MKKYLVVLISLLIFNNVAHASDINVKETCKMEQELTKDASGKYKIIEEEVCSSTPNDWKDGVS